MNSVALPKGLLEGIESLAGLGPITAELGRKAIERLWFQAAKRMDDERIFLSTGDIPAMWIRDSTWQVRPLVRFAHDDEVDEFISCIIKTQAFYLSIDPYANAFNPSPNGNCWSKDFSDQSPWVFERKFELDSITGFWQLSLDYIAAKQDTSLLDRNWWVLTKRLVELLWDETEHEPEAYVFYRPDNPAHDSLSNEGRGGEYSKCGLIWSAFRPSDDACELPFLIPSNLHAMVTLRRLAILAEAERPELALSCVRLADRIECAIRDHAIIEFEGKKVLAYEVNGRGGFNFMDDANYPNLTSLSFLGFDDQNLIRHTREFALSPSNPWYFQGPFGAGLGSPHTGQDQVWPLGIAMAGITSMSLEDKLSNLRMIEKTIARDSIHESFSVHDPNLFTRDWFSWAEMTYVELAFQILEGKSH